MSILSDLSNNLVIKHFPKIMPPAQKAETRSDVTSQQQKKISDFFSVFEESPSFKRYHFSAKNIKELPRFVAFFTSKVSSHLQKNERIDAFFVIIGMGQDPRSVAWKLDAEVKKNSGTAMNAILMIGQCEDSSKSDESLTEFEFTQERENGTEKDTVTTIGIGNKAVEDLAYQLTYALDIR